MKKHKPIVKILFFVIIVFSGFGLQYIPSFSKDQDDKVNKGIELKISAEESHVYEWNVTWGGVGDEESRGVAVDSLNNVYICGRTDSWGEGAVDAILVKHNSEGTLLWNRTWGGLGSDIATGVAVDSVNNVYITGSTWNGSFLVKYSSTGVFQWNRTVGSVDDFIINMALEVDSSNNIYVAAIRKKAGETIGNDAFLMKYNSVGDQLWNRTWSGAENDNPNGITTDLSGNIYVTGPTQSWTDGLAIFLLKYNNMGVLQWNISWGGISTNSDWSYDTEIDSSGNIYVIGEEFISQMNWLLVRFNSSGTPLWNKTWGLGRGQGIVLDSADNIYLSGIDASVSSTGEMVLYKLNNNGVQLWNLTGYGSLAGVGRHNEPKCVIDLLENIYIVGTTSDDNIVLAKFHHVTDFVDPIITINSPSPGGEFGDSAPDYAISITEPNLELFWYTIDDGVTNYTITELSGTINQGAWDAASYGSISIGFYARDLEGNEGYNSVIVQKIEEDGAPPPPPDIPSTPTRIILGVLLITIVLIIIRNRYRIRVLRRSG